MLRRAVRFTPVPPDCLRGLLQMLQMSRMSSSCSSRGLLSTRTCDRLCVVVFHSEISVSRNDDDNELLESDSRINNNDEEENFSGHSFLCGIISNNHVQKQKRKKIMSQTRSSPPGAQSTTVTLSDISYFARTTVTPAVHRNSDLTPPLQHRSTLHTSYFIRPRPTGTTVVKHNPARVRGTERCRGWFCPGSAPDSRNFLPDTTAAFELELTRLERKGYWLRCSWDEEGIRRETENIPADALTGESIECACRADGSLLQNGSGRRDDCEEAEEEERKGKHLVVDTSFLLRR
ncbi:hypothetical protein F2P81_018939 [Scophthalmus maximus]|uniref:Uncharacterized protein n=1 Tax=Scophthalmus maximus TaxID=52904 RepID=A0A6A4SFY8_SCOMX|nr:hypothetical protein F2P81_018939 [Scophthalmus maximus]